MWNLWHNVYFIKILTRCFWPKTNQHFLLALSYRLMGTAIPRRKNKPITQNWTSQHPFLEQARLQTKQAHGWCWRSRSLLCLYFSHYVGSKHFKTRFACCFFTLLKHSATCFRSMRVLFIFVYVARTYLLRYNDFEFTKFTQMPLNYHNNSPHSPMLQIIADLLTRAYIVETFDRSPYCGTIPPRLCHHKITPWIPWVPMLGRSQNHMPSPSIHWTLRRWKRIQKANGPWVHHGSKPTTLQSWWLVVFLGGLVDNDF